MTTRNWRQVHRESLSCGRRRYDSLSWYQAMTSALDGISLVGAGSTTFVTVKTVMTIKNTTDRSVTDILRRLSRQERAKLTHEVLRLQNPRHAREMIRLKQLAGKLPKRFSNPQLRRDILIQLADQVGAVIAITGSSLSGNINQIVIALYEEFDNHEQ
ncbi:hypothetical protein [Pseudomonas sp. EA_15y_Pfl1_P104]|uniref:hypothetical protein n=1 Tax=Pseudomonas sp. EA_15y_Pfl1_P104 TaxID=3088686 RepID=UPI00403F0846